MTKEILDIVQTVPSISDRAKLLGWMAKVAADKKRLERTMPSVSLRMCGTAVELEKICQWIDRTWPHPHRVRHHAARQVARKLREGALESL